jgi:WD40-like Beta Propeller Repeat
MKKTFLLICLLLTACAAPAAATSTPTSFFDSSTPPAADPAAAPVTLGVDSTSAQIQLAMLTSAARWKTIQLDGMVTWFVDGQPVQSLQEQVWLDPLNDRYKVKWNGVLNSPDAFLKFSDGENINSLNLHSGQVETFPYPAAAKVGQYVPPLVDGQAHPNPIWAQIGTPLSQLAFPSDYAQNTGIFTPLEMTSIAGREALVVEWRFGESSAPFWKMWMDTQTAVILKLQEFGKDGGSSVQGERVVNQVIFDQEFDPSVFVMPSDVAVASEPAQSESNPLVTQSSPPSDRDAGELYFFLQPRQAGQSIQLVRVSGVCVYDSAKCPAVEPIAVPFAFNFTINALSWSADGKYAAFSYSDHAAGTPTQLWLFDAAARSWTAIAQFPYIDPPFWSRDGSWIAFRTQDGLGAEDVYIVHPNGTDLKSISSGLPADGRPYIMDGWYTENVIMRSALPGHEGSIYLVRAENGQARPMFDTLLTKAAFVASPDISSLAYDEYDSVTQNHILKVMEPGGAHALPLASFNGGSLYPLIWSPDSKLIAFNYYTSFAAGEPAAQVYVVNKDGSNLSRVYQGVTVGRLVFSPNGKYLLIEETTSSTGGHLFLVNLTTLEQKILQAPGLSTEYDWYAPSWRP